MTTPNPILFHPAPSRTVQRITASMLTGLAALSLHVQDASAQDAPVAPTTEHTTEHATETSDAALEQEIKTLEQEVTDTKTALDEANVCVAERKRAGQEKEAKAQPCRDVKKVSEAHAKSTARLKVVRKQESQRKHSHEHASKTIRR